MKRNHFYFALLSATLALNIQASAEVQLLPPGEFAARDGRPGLGEKWKLTDAQGKQLAQRMTELAAQTKFSFDYEHQTIYAPKNGQPAPASGWATQFEWRSGQGLFATDVKWTERALKMIEGGEYLYISPLITWNASGEVTGVLNAALVNYPALLGMSPIGKEMEAALATQFSAPTQTEIDMPLLQQLIAALSLAATATETEALSAVTALVSKANEKPAAVPAALATALSIKPDADEATALSAVTALQQKATGSDATTLQTITALQGQLNTMQADLNKQSVSELIEQGLKDGKLLPATRPWAEALGGKDIHQLKAFLDAQPALPAGQRQSKDETDPESNKAALSGVAADVATRLGLSPKQFSAAATA
jgi:phage I-like protein